MDRDDMNTQYFGKYSDLNNLRTDFDQLNLSGNLSDNNSFHLHTESLSSTHDDLERKRKELLRLNKSIDLVNKTLKEKEQKVLSKMDLDIPQKSNTSHLRYKYGSNTTKSI